MAKHTKNKENPSQKSLETSQARFTDEVTDEQIRRRAYEIYLTRGGRAGDPVADWLQAEYELRDGIRRGKR